jgi:predicted MFS family arabinose efflux permease
VPASVQATAQGIFSGTAFSLGSILGAVVGGVLAGPLSIPGLFALSAAGTVAGAAIILRATRVRRGPRTARGD